MRLRDSTIAAAVCALALGCGTGRPGDPRNSCDGQQVDLQTDVNHCGSCTNACPDQPHAMRTCTEAQCGRTACDPGWSDLYPSVPGCETAGAGGLPESGLVFAALTAGGAHGSLAQTGPQHTNLGATGEPTPALEGGAVESSNAQHRNVTGFNAAMH